MTVVGYEITQNVNQLNFIFEPIYKSSNKANKMSQM